MEHLENLIAKLRLCSASMPDKRTGQNIRYQMADVGLAAFSVFFMQQPSFLAFQKTLHDNIGLDNTQTLFSMGSIPPDNHIRQLLDGVSPSHFDEMFFHVLDAIDAGNDSPLRNILGNHTLIALDGSEYFCSKKISCPNCSTRKHSNGEIDYFHTFLGATVVRPGKPEVFPLPSEFVVPQDGDNKQDCEFKAVKRWLERIGPSCSKLNPIYLGDDLFAKEPVCRDILQQGGNFLFTCKDSSHKTLAEFRKGIVPSNITEIKGRSDQKREYCYSWIESLPIKDGKDALNVNWIEITIKTIKGKITYNSSYITNIVPTKDNIIELVAAARTRWKIENETFNVLKNNGYHLEHNFGHGRKTLSSILVVFNLLAFAMHNACDLLEKPWQAARDHIGARNRFFLQFAITSYVAFSSWDQLMLSISTGRAPPANSSPVC
jgi:hypothetical protein